MQGRLRLVPSFTVTSPGWEENDWPEVTEWNTSQRRNMAGLRCSWWWVVAARGGLCYMGPDYNALATAVITHNSTIS